MEQNKWLNALGWKKANKCMNQWWSGQKNGNEQMKQGINLQKWTIE